MKFLKKPTATHSIIQLAYGDKRKFWGRLFDIGERIPERTETYPGKVEISEFVVESDIPLPLVDPKDLIIEDLTLYNSYFIEQQGNEYTGVCDYFKYHD